MARVTLERIKMTLDHGVASGGALVEAKIKSVEVNGNMLNGISKPSLVAAR